MQDFLYESFYRLEKDHWWFRARLEIVSGLILPLEQKNSVIDFGCGTGVMLEHLSRYCDVTGMDNSPLALDFCRKRFSGKLVETDLSQDIPFTQKYDIGLSLDVIEHLRDDIEALKNMKSALKENGRLIVTVPAFRFLWSAHDVNNEHKRRYTAKTLKTAALKAGYKIEYISYYSFWLMPLVMAMRFIGGLFGINKNSGMETKMHGRFINGLLYRIFKSEKFFISRRLRLPVGASIIAVLKAV